MYDTLNGQLWSPLGDIRSEANPVARFQVFDSSLSENAVLGYEYGYALLAKDSLTLWEAQFGDFSNGAQVIIDQYISASEDKWKQTCRLVMLLPHGYEGQGPEHSSARLERYLQLCAENNLQVCYPTTPAQYFHLLRRQVKQEISRPLVVMTPKSLLRLPAASSTVEELTTGGFNPVLDDARVKDKSKVVFGQSLLRSRRRTQRRRRRPRGDCQIGTVLPVSESPFAGNFRFLRKRDAAFLDAGRTAKHGRLDVCRKSSARDQRRFDASLRRTLRFGFARDRQLRDP
jgi:2-oxoglutarate dehydrogenase complex dehydrogenase (E1) component-like enzyme